MGTATTIIEASKAALRCSRWRSSTKNRAGERVDARYGDSAVITPQSALVTTDDNRRQPPSTTDRPCTIQCDDAVLVFLIK